MEGNEKKSFRVLIDADACPVYRLAEKIAKEKRVPVILFADTNHVLTSDYASVIPDNAGLQPEWEKIVPGGERQDTAAWIYLTR